VILEALVRHYDRLAADPESGIAAHGYSRQKIGFCVVLNDDGSLHAIEPMTDDSSGKPRPIELVVPGQSKPSGSGINPCFLWDNATYLLGHVPEGRDQDWATTRFEGFRSRHLGLSDQIDDDGFRAVCAFLEAWSPANLSDRNDTEPLARPGFGVFRLRGESGYLHDRPAIHAYWESQLDTEDSAVDAETGMCLVTGRHGRLARLHEPKIKGVAGAQSSGATLVSFNLDAFSSHLKDQGYNASVSESAAFKYATALNRLLGDEKHRVQLGDTTCVFWTEKPETGAAEAVSETLGVWDFTKPSSESQEVETRTALRDFLNRYRQATAAPAAKKLEDADAPFYVLGLSPNAARISVRFWLRCTVRELAERLGRHVSASTITGGRNGQDCPTLREMLRETGREAKDIPPQLAGDLSRAVLMGTVYPNTLAVAILRRIVADAVINHPRAAGLKAWLTHNHEMEPPVSLDPSRTDVAYLLGRLFAVYEKTQKDALGQDLNRTIRDSYLSSASMTPAAVFPRLYRLNQHHFNKLRRDKTGLAVVRERLIGEICQGLSTFPPRLQLQEQGLFAIGYYHQTQDFYTRRAEKDVAGSDNGE